MLSTKLWAMPPRVCHYQCKKKSHLGLFYLEHYLYPIVENDKFIFYTAYYEDFKSVFFKAINCDFYNANADFNGIGVDDANNVHDEILVKVRD